MKVPKKRFHFLRTEASALYLCTAVFFQEIFYLLTRTSGAVSVCTCVIGFPAVEKTNGANTFAISMRRKYYLLETIFCDVSNGGPAYLTKRFPVLIDHISDGRSSNRLPSMLTTSLSGHLAHKNLQIFPQYTISCRINKFKSQLSNTLLGKMKIGWSGKTKLCNKV